MNICPTCHMPIEDPNPRRKVHAGECWRARKRETRNEYYRVIGHRKGAGEKARQEVFAGSHSAGSGNILVEYPGVAGPDHVSPRWLETWRGQLEAGTIVTEPGGKVWTV